MLRDTLTELHQAADIVIVKKVSALAFKIELVLTNDN